MKQIREPELKNAETLTPAELNDIKLCPDKS